MKTSDKLKFLARLPLTWFHRIVLRTPKVMSDLDTIKYICDNKCSISRFGDGELDLMFNASIKFQQANNLLQSRLKQISKQPSDNKFLLCLPNIFLNWKQLKEKFIYKDYLWWRKHLIATRGLWHSLFRQEVYGDATLTRFYVELNDKERAANYVAELKKIWEGQNIVFVEGYNSRLGMGNDLFNNANSIKRILCPSKNAFDKYDEILQTVLINTSKDDLIICALGPTATVLSYDLSKSDRWSLDLGHVDIEYEWFLMRAQVQVNVKGKDMGETTDAFQDDENKRPTNVIAEIE